MHAVLVFHLRPRTSAGNSHASTRPDVVAVEIGQGLKIVHLTLGRAWDRRYLRRNKAGQFKKKVNVGRSLAADLHRKAKTKVANGQGDRGDTKRGGNVLRRLVQKLTGGRSLGLRPRSYSVPTGRHA